MNASFIPPFNSSPVSDMTKAINCHSLTDSTLWGGLDSSDPVYLGHMSDMGRHFPQPHNPSRPHSYPQARAHTIVRRPLIFPFTPTTASIHESPRHLAQYVFSRIVSNRARNESIPIFSSAHKAVYSQPPRRADCAQFHLPTDARLYSGDFPPGHKLNKAFVSDYELQDALGSGGYGFVMTARDRVTGDEVAVKFITKSKVPDHAWVDTQPMGRIPTEVLLLSYVDHPGVVKCLDVYEDALYFYLVQELHGCPWQRSQQDVSHQTIPLCALISTASQSPETPVLSLSPSPSEGSTAVSEPTTPCENGNTLSSQFRSFPNIGQTFLDAEGRPEFSRRPSHDLFECIEQSKLKRLSEDHARYVFQQIVDTVVYLDSLGITHRDIKDENIVIDSNLKVKLIDFGSAIIVNPHKPRPFHTNFYGTSAYASSEILLKKSYQAPPAEIWTLGVLLSYLLTGASPFPTLQDAVKGNIMLTIPSNSSVSPSAMALLKACLDADPNTRATIQQVKCHPWLRGSVSM